MKITCIMCPMGCEMEVNQKDEKFTVTGNSCIRGERYARSELTAPSRMVTALLNTKQGVVAVKTTNLVPKDKVFAVLDEISKLQLDKATLNQTVIKNVIGLDNTNVVVTREAISD